MEPLLPHTPSPAPSTPSPTPAPVSPASPTSPTQHSAPQTPASSQTPPVPQTPPQQRPTVPIPPATVHFPTTPVPPTPPIVPVHSARKGLALLGWIFLIIVLVTAGAFYAAGDSLARYFWNSEKPYLALFFDRSDATLALNIGDYYFGRAEYDIDLAQAAFEKAIALDGAIPRGHYQLARIYFVKGDFEDALAHVNKEMAVNPTFPRSFYMRGLIKSYSGDLSGAEEDFRRFIELVPNEWGGYNDLAGVLGAEKKYDDAITIINQAFKNAPNASQNVWLWNSLGVMQLNNKQYKEAVVSFQKASDLAKNLTFAEWHKAYPGNNPAVVAQGLTRFQSSISLNLQRAKNATAE